jgi:hypothetical protein
VTQRSWGGVPVFVGTRVPDERFLHVMDIVQTTSRPMASSRYDPDRPPDPEWWHALDETQRIHAVEAFHRKARVRLPNATVHAAIHVIVENQIALGSEIPVAATLARLMQQGLDRHDALHAIGSVLAAHMNALVRDELGSDEDPNVAYFAALAELTPRSWRTQFG